MTLYTEEGYDNRTDYLETLATRYGLDLNEILTISESIGGSGEDFESLVDEIELCIEDH